MEQEDSPSQHKLIKIFTKTFHLQGSFHLKKCFFMPDLDNLNTCNKIKMAKLMLWIITIKQITKMIPAD